MLLIKSLSYWLQFKTSLQTIQMNPLLAPPSFTWTSSKKKIKTSTILHLTSLEKKIEVLMKEANNYSFFNLAKLNFPKFSGDDPTEWFTKVEQFFKSAKLNFPKFSGDDPTEWFTIISELLTSIQNQSSNNPNEPSFSSTILHLNLIREENRSFNERGSLLYPLKWIFRNFLEIIP